MFSLIFAIISIGLVVALAASTMYYLAVSSDKHAKEAAAAGLLTQGEQIVAAIDMRSVTADGDLTNLQQLVARNYLSSMPTPAAGTYAEGLVAKDSDWWLLAPGMLPAVMLQNKLDAETCLAVNRKLGLEGVKSKPDAGRRIQCFGDAAPYTLLLNPSAKPDVLGPAIDAWNQCVADPTSPGCAATIMPEPFCVANPTNAACTTSTSTPVCVADPTNALCVPPPDPDQSFCATNPTHPACTKTPALCDADPMNELCLSYPGPGLSFCEVSPANPVCLTPTTPAARLCDVDPTNALCTIPNAPTGGWPGGGGMYCKAPLGCTYCWMSNPTTGSCLTTPMGTDPTLPFIVPTGAKTLPAPELNGGPDSCVPVVKEASGGYAIKSSCNASWCQNPIDGGSWKIIGAETTGLYGCKPAGVTTLPVCTLDIAIDTVYNRPELLSNPVIAQWAASDNLTWSADSGWVSYGWPYPTLSAFKAEILGYGHAPDNLLSSLPADVCTPPPPPNYTPFKAAAVTVTGAGTSCALTATGAVKCWGYNEAGGVGDGTWIAAHTPVQVVGLGSGVQALTQNCALTATGAVKCWGYNGSGQLGDGTLTWQNTPVQVVGLESGVQTISGGGGHVCAITATGAVACWGANEAGQLGDWTMTSWASGTPVPVVGLGGVQSVAAGGYHTCAITATGAVNCWGGNQSGQLGDGTTTNSSTPVQVIGLESGVQSIAAGGGWGYYTCAVTATGAVNCWGNNQSGQLGNGTTTNSSTPVQVIGLESGVQSIAAGEDHTCAITATGAVNCWGGNQSGQLGNGTTTASSTPVQVIGLESGVQSIAAGGSHTCAVTATGAVTCWGSNWNGELGNGKTTDSSTPVQVVEELK